ncbi:hypothetical protein BSZ19_24715 [Bradyrhizobium japonicum]|uniref:Uncharacterized protein n=1 Tax=Bradyrhizobium japonicum TaxID=375 RepID=A0A1Y2JLV4_BRAJP|nr:hypothetical protein BSZ19_24715 [Bradyrhizobium japonicum]
MPGDIVIERKNMTAYFPLMTCLLLSVLLWCCGLSTGDRQNLRAAGLHGAVTVIDGRQGHPVAMPRILHGRFTGSL